MRTTGQEESDKIRIVVVGAEDAQNKSIIETINNNDDMAYVGAATDLHGALELVKSLQPAIILVESTTEILDFTIAVLQINANTGILIISDMKSSKGAQNVVNALAAGAFDVVPAIDSSATASNLLLSRIRCCSIKQYSRIAKIGNKSAIAPTSGKNPNTISRYQQEYTRNAKYSIILIGVSTGGPEALMKLLPEIHASIPIPIVIVLHMPKSFTAAMAEALDRKCQIRVTEAIDGETIRAGHAYLSPGGQHCSLISNSDGSLRIQLSDGPAENGCKPSVDVLFRSIPSGLGPKTIAFVLTGMGSDGTSGAQDLKQIGARVIVQDEASSVVWGMPGSVVRSGCADEVVPLDSIPTRLRDLLEGA